MTEYGPEPVSDHARVVSSGAWLGAAVFCSAIGWADSHLPHLVAWLLNWTAILAVCYAMACWKRAWYAWLAFWGMTATCLLSGILQLAGAMDSQWSAASWWTACLMLFIWYWLIRMPRLRAAVQAVERREIHVIHHIVHHGPQLPGWTATEITTETAVPVPAPVRKIIAGAAVRMIGTRIRNDGPDDHCRGSQ